MSNARVGATALAALSFAFAAPAAGDLTLTNNSGTATVETHYGPGSFLSPQTVTDTFGPSGGVAFAELDMRSFGRTRGVQTGDGLNAVGVDARLGGDIPSFGWSASTNYEVNVAETGPGSTSLDFEYHLNGGQLKLYDPNEDFTGLVASARVSIFTSSPGFDGILWSWHLTLRGFGGVVTPTVDFLIDPLGFGVPAASAVTISGGEASLDIDSFTASANLGVIDDTSFAFVKYDMESTVTGVGFNATGGRAVLGDPFHPTGNYGAALTFAGATTAGGVPEPSALALVLAGVALIPAFARVRRRVAQHP